MIATESSGDRYPDGGSCIVSQRQISCSTGFCEVKADYMKNNTVSTHLELLRLCIFGKDTIDNEDVENVVLLQAVGHRVIVYLYQQHDGGFYSAFEVDSIEVPKSILELPGFIMKLDDIKRLINLYELFCATKKDRTDFFRRKIPSPNIYEMNIIINTRKPKKVKTSLEF
ncbi:hypothetical protein MFLAVUS_009798 [Mucor flavus]|uniref:Uncharacterized protein n=1 Tax=Mucor flavus TaxID=439312 RepID=A0ABP9ZAX6_9FUNG